MPNRWWPFLRRGAREFLHALWSALAPPHCPACGVACEGLCPSCAGALRSRAGPWCRRCGEPLPPGLPCGRRHAALRGLRFARAPFRYRGAGGALVRRLKFRKDLGAGRILARAMAGMLREWVRNEGRRALVVAVPLHPARLRRRRFDQTAWLAAEVGRRLGLEVAAGVLRRRRDTLPQGDVRVVSRVRNVAGAFVVERSRAVAGRWIVLVDDVATSGATARACGEVLRAAGARHVVLLTAADAGLGMRADAGWGARR